MLEGLNKNNSFKAFRRGPGCSKCSLNAVVGSYLVNVRKTLLNVVVASSTPSPTPAVRCLLWSPENWSWTGNRGLGLTWPLFLCVDFPVPKVEAMDKRLGFLVDEFKELVYPPDYSPKAEVPVRKQGEELGVDGQWVILKSCLSDPITEDNVPSEISIQT